MLPCRLTQPSARRRRATISSPAHLSTAGAYSLPIRKPRACHRPPDLSMPGLGRAELEAALGFVVRLERAGREPTPEADYVELGGEVEMVTPSKGSERGMGFDQPLCQAFPNERRHA